PVLRLDSQGKSGGDDCWREESVERFGRERAGTASANKLERKQNEARERTKRARREIRKMKAILALEDGTVFHGTAFGARASACGEVCFNTSMTGYQEILTDPSYKGQIVTMTYPLIGNYGVNPQDVESWQPH